MAALSPCYFTNTKKTKKIEEQNVIKIDYLKIWHCESLYQAPQSWLYWLKEEGNVGYK